MAQGLSLARDEECASTDGDEYWFGPENVAGTPFEHIEVGAEVQFISEVAAEGRQAKRITLGKHRFE
jgi:hypothetical protein